MTEEVEKKIDPENTLILETSKGNVVIELLPDKIGRASCRERV